ncbi:hypothetical protein PVAP13_5KG712401 [Panicum virgatum]|uniref:Uncharacterized protein n=1 Tax=Panicum virgatum TaxID=38727 RepID=A0A8T0SXN0_PANVG|nr:hypothetical protein PVAP13_5KG712401 [Panicum virgatum]
MVSEQVGLGILIPPEIHCSRRWPSGDGSARYGPPTTRFAAARRGSRVGAAVVALFSAPSPAPVRRRSAPAPALVRRPSAPHPPIRASAGRRLWSSPPARFPPRAPPPVCGRRRLCARAAVAPEGATTAWFCSAGAVAPLLCSACVLQQEKRVFRCGN